MSFHSPSTWIHSKIWMFQPLMIHRILVQKKTCNCLFLFSVPSPNADNQCLAYLSLTFPAFAWIDLHKVATRNAQSSRALDNMPVLVLSGLCQGYDLLSTYCMYTVYIHIYLLIQYSTFFTMQKIINHISIVMFYTYIEPLLAPKKC